LQGNVFHLPHPFLRKQTHLLSLWMISSAKPKQLLGSIIYLCLKSKLLQNLPHRVKIRGSK
jgi:hypothetical protein